MRASHRGFTLIELLVVIAILSLLIVAFWPNINDVRGQANKVADAANMRRIFAWVESGRQTRGHYPTEGGHRFVLAPWVDGTVEKTRPNLMRFFNPALAPTNERLIELRKQDPDQVWQRYEDLDSLDTDYAGRAKGQMRGMDSGREAWIADDNEGGASFADGSINILYGDGLVAQLTAGEMKERLGFDVKTGVFPSCGPDSPEPALRKLAQ